jgi:hypothetical protein
VSPLEWTRNAVVQVPRRWIPAIESKVGIPPQKDGPLIEEQENLGGR